MAKLAPQGWNFTSFDNFSDWSDELGDAHTSSALSKHRSTLVCLSNSINELSNPLPTIQTLPEPDPTPSVTRAKGKKPAPPSPTPDDPSLVLLNDPLVRSLNMEITDPLIRSICL
jgi:hypothetical protein